MEVSYFYKCSKKASNMTQQHRHDTQKSYKHQCFSSSVISLKIAAKNLDINDLYADMQCVEDSACELVLKSRRFP